jgi:hypothetical protein
MEWMDAGDLSDMIRIMGNNFNENFVVCMAYNLLK